MKKIHRYPSRDEDVFEKYQFSILLTFPFPSPSPSSLPLSFSPSFMIVGEFPEQKEWMEEEKEGKERENLMRWGCANNKLRYKYFKSIFDERIRWINTFFSKFIFPSMRKEYEGWSESENSMKIFELMSCCFYKYFITHIFTERER